MHTAIVGAVLGYLLGHWLGNFIASGYSQVQGTGPERLRHHPRLRLRDGRLAGRPREFNDLGRQIAGRPVHADQEAQAASSGLARYFRYSLDHKVVGIQYLVGMIGYFLTGGLLAMAIRTELLSPSYHVFSSATYTAIVGEHGTMMMMMMSSVILGPLGNYLVPLMIGSKRMAFPRIEALSFG